MLNHVPYDPDSPIPRLPIQAKLKGLIAAVVFVALAAGSGFGVLMLWRDLLEPFLANGPVIRVSFGTFAMLGVFPGMLLAVMFVALVWLGYLRGWPRRRIERNQRRLLPAAWTALAVMIAGVLVGGPASSGYLASTDYIRCESLEAAGLFPEHVYVQHPFLCVEREHLGEELAIYQNLLSAQKNGRLREALALHSMKVTSDGYIVPAD